MTDATSCSEIGEQKVKEGLNQLIKRTDADELMIVTDIFDPEAYIGSLEITA